MAPTGVAAFNIGGSTIHHELAITADKNLSYKKLEAERCRRMQVDFKGTKLIIIDEYNMIDIKMLANIDLRVRDIFSTNEHFGNISVVLVGDMRQLPFVFYTPLYAEGGGELQLIGTLSYFVFKQCVPLEQVFRQSGVEVSEYREALSRLATPLLKIGNSKEANSDEAKVLEDVLLLSKQLRVMLSKNDSTQFGLVNGSTGTVKDIIYDNEEKSPTCMPIAVRLRQVYRSKGA
ncbi:uncharacterized protein LOC113311360 [Papaver somniferum]|uniref:uncharacterized protein LOC113311360 n=1 Tax=Papaver somniferum TaxID=3469 RepID=UPI000E6FCCF5|nr:uncharacterized protein LOC113311360 [Papaver somniferum]